MPFHQIDKPLPLQCRLPNIGGVECQSARCLGDGFHGLIQPRRLASHQTDGRTNLYKRGDHRYLSV